MQVVMTSLLCFNSSLGLWWDSCPTFALATAFATSSTTSELARV